MASVVEQVQTSEQQLSLPRLANMSDAGTSLVDAASNQRDIMTSFASLMNKMAILVEIGDEVAKVGPHYFCTVV